MFEKLAYDIYKTAALKLANALRDRVRLGRISPETFKILRASKKYLPFEQYQNLSKLDKATYQQSLMRDLKSKLRGRGKTDSISQYDNFVQNEFNGDFTEDQYNKLFGYQTGYPSVGRMARGIIKGVNNRIEDVNKRINKYNNNPKNVNREKLPTLELFSNNHRAAKELSLEDFGIENIPQSIQQSILDFVRSLEMDNGPRSAAVQNGKKIEISIPSTVELRDDSSGDKFLRPYSIVSNTKDRNMDVAEYIPSVYKQPGVEMGSRAITLQHEFDEALNMINQISRLGQKHPSLENNTMSRILNDSHASSNVIGNEFLTNNAIFGSTFNSPIGLARAVRSSPVTSITEPGENNLSGQAIGLDYSKPDGGFSDQFKSMKEFKKFLKQVQQKDIKILQDNSYTDLIKNRESLVKDDLPYIDAATTKYFPNWNRNVTAGDIKNYYENLRRNIDKSNQINSISGGAASENAIDNFERFLKSSRRNNARVQLPSEEFADALDSGLL